MLLLVVAASIVLHLAGIQRDLPFAPEADEPVFVVPAVSIASSGDLNPGWFGHPGSTMIYPMSLGFRMWYAAVHGGSFLAPDSSLAENYVALAPQLVMLGRLLSVTYSILCVPIVYLLALRAFGRRQALLAAVFAAALPVPVQHAQIVRTDAAATFYALLAILLCLVVLERPRIVNQVFAGFTLGLAIATRYFMVTLLPVLIAVDIVLLRRGWSGHTRNNRPLVIGMAAGLLAAPLAFFLASPYVILDLPTVTMSLLHEARSENVGSDGLSPLGNFVWYVTHALPEALTWPLYVLAVVGILLALRQRNLRAAVVLLFPTVLIVAICFAALHWTRWLIQIMPVMASFGAYGLVAATDAASRWLRWDAGRGRWLLAGAAALVLVPLIGQVVLNDVRQARDSTRVEARAWMLANVPAGSKVGVEWWTAPLFADDFEVFQRERHGRAGGSWDRDRGVDGDGGFEVAQYWRLPAAGDLASYRDNGYDYLVVSGNWFGPYLAESERYPYEYAFYKELFDSSLPVVEFVGGQTKGGPLIRVYELAEP